MKENWCFTAENLYFRGLTVPDSLTFAHELDQYPCAAPNHYRYRGDLSQLRLWLADLGLTILFSEVFARHSGSRCEIHTDGDPTVPHVKLNFVYGNSPDCFTEWLRPRPGFAPEDKITAVGSQYQALLPERSLAVARYHCAGVTLFNAGIFHSVRYINSDRWCFSFMLGDQLGQHISWDQALSLFQPWITES